jgi:hypothetical protein
MGNNASVSIANITASLELEKLWTKEMLFRGRFIDDILSLIDVTDITEPLDDYISRIFQHKFLKFTYEFSFESVPFLDLNVQLKNNNIITSLYKKPMSKHEYLHFTSSHPKHILKSLPYSCGLRIIRCCSEETTKINELKSMMSKFENRHYPNTLLEPIQSKLLQIDRLELIKPKTKLHIQAINLHYPNLHLPTDNTDILVENSQQNVYIVLPFYQTIPNLKHRVHSNIWRILLNCRSPVLKKAILDLNIQVAYTIPNQMSRMLNSK